jgi:hypothetical protein
MQISNTKLEEIVKNSKFDANSVAVHAESNVIEQNLKEEKATKAISQLQDQLAVNLTSYVKTHKSFIRWLLKKKRKLKWN